MKKMVIFLMISLGLVTSVFAGTVELSDSVVENFGARIVKKNLDTYDDNSLGLWYLKKKYYDKWERVRDDEFELDDAKVWAFQQLKKKLNRLAPFKKGTEYSLYLSVKTGKYDFKTKSFPVRDALSANSYMRYSGKGFFVDRWDSSALLFENASDSVNFIPMKKAAAKEFIKSHKDDYGNIDRDILAHYVFIITSFSEDEEFKSDGTPMTIKFMGKLKSVEFMDKNGKHVLKSAKF